MEIPCVDLEPHFAFQRIVSPLGAIFALLLAIFHSSPLPLPTTFPTSDSVSIWTVFWPLQQRRACVWVVVYMYQ